MESNGGYSSRNACYVCGCLSVVWLVFVVLLKTGEREDRYESAIADLKARLKNVSYSCSFCA